MRDRDGLDRAMAELLTYLPADARLILVVGAVIKRKYHVAVLSNQGWGPGWLTVYQQQQLYRLDPVWNGPCQKLIIWRGFYERSPIPVKRKFVNFAKAEGFQCGVSWKNLVENKTLILSVASEEIEDDDFAKTLMVSLGDLVLAAALRVIDTHPDIITLDRNEYTAITAMMQFRNDVDAARQANMTIAHYRYMLTCMQKRFAAKNRFDLINKVCRLSFH